MIFNSIEFAIFLPVVFILYWIIPAQRTPSRNFILLCASYIFYGWWDWRFLSLLLFSSFVDYAIGLGLHKFENPQKRKLLLISSIGVNLSLLGVFKYYNFFVDSFVEAFTFFGGTFEASRLDVILPVGISFYTFQTLSYSIDVYRRNLPPTHDPLSFFTYVAFFPQLVAGPIERATHLLPQFSTRKLFSYSGSVDGLRQILWGLFKKVVIADNSAVVVDATFSEPSSYNASTLVLGALLFAFQIYGDFSGYSDIAIGTARLFGFDLKQNFAFPYFSRSIAEFWRRWHISLSTWFRDYLYIPLGGSRGARIKVIRNTMIIFLVSGFWHGANWTFIVWGLLHALFFMPSLIMKTNRHHIESISSLMPSVIDFVRIGCTFILVDFAWIFFRADSVQDAIEYIGCIFSRSILEKPELVSSVLIFQIMILLVVEWLNRHEAHGLSIGRFKSLTTTKPLVYVAIALNVICFGESSDSFIYFQF